MVQFTTQMGEPLRLNAPPATRTTVNALSNFAIARPYWR
jgi:hypothetical protein